MSEKRVCVTGAGGYIASWLVKLLLSKGYLVHGTVRDSDPKNDHLKSLENARENLPLFNADLLDYDGISAAVSGCTGVIHLASPVPLDNVANPEFNLLEPALVGTKNVLTASLNAKAKKVVVVSSITAVAITSESPPKVQPMDETCRSDIDYCKSSEYRYCVAKMLAETEALEFAGRTGLNVTMICPSIAIGPMLQSTFNSSSLYLLAIMKGILRNISTSIVGLREIKWWLGCWLVCFLFNRNNPFECIGTCFIDVRDRAEAILLVYQSPEAEGRYICSASEVSMQELVNLLKEIHPEYDYPKGYEEVPNAVRLSSNKLQNLGCKHRAFEETLVDAIRNY